MAYDYILTALIPASPQDIYDAWLDSRAHSAMTGGRAVQSPEVGAEVSAWDDYISGRNLELVPGERIVQSWRTTEFSDEHEDSIVTLTLEETEGGTLLTLTHSNVPEEQTSYEEGGWATHYFEPMQRYFATAAAVGDVIAEREAAEEEEEAAAEGEAAPQRAARARKKRPAKKAAAKKSAAKSAKKRAAKKGAAKKSRAKKAAKKSRKAASKKSSAKKRGRKAKKK